VKPTGSVSLHSSARRRPQWNAQAGGSPPRRRDSSSTLGVTAGRTVRRAHGRQPAAVRRIRCCPSGIVRMNPNDRRRLQWDAQAGGSPPRRRDPSSTLGVTAIRAVRRRKRNIFTCSSNSTASSGGRTHVAHEQEQFRSVHWPGPPLRRYTNYRATALTRSIAVHSKGKHPQLTPCTHTHIRRSDSRLRHESVALAPSLA